MGVGGSDPQKPRISFAASAIGARACRPSSALRSVVGCRLPLVCGDAQTNHLPCSLSIARGAPWRLLAAKSFPPNHLLHFDARGIAARWRGDGLRRRRPYRLHSGLNGVRKSAAFHLAVMSAVLLGHTTSKPESMNPLTALPSTRCSNMSVTVSYPHPKYF